MKYPFIIIITTVSLNFYGQTKRTYPIDKVTESKATEKAKDDSLLEVYDRAIKMNSDDIDTYYKRANLRMKIADKNIVIKGVVAAPFSKNYWYDAEKDYRKVLKLNDKVKYADTVYYQLGIIEGRTFSTRSTSGGSEMTSYANAYFNFNKAVNINPNYAEAYLERGKAIIHGAGRNKDAKDAIEDFTKVITLSTKLAGEAYYWRGIAKQNSKDNSGACTDWSKAVSSGYENAKIIINKTCK